MREKGRGDQSRHHGPFKRPINGDYTSWWDYAKQRNLNPESLANQVDAYARAFREKGTIELREKAQSIYLSKISQVDPRSQKHQPTQDAIKTLSYKVALAEAPTEVKNEIAGQVQQLALSGAF